MASEQVSTELLRGFSPLDGLKRDNLAALARKVQIREMSPGQLLFKEGDTEKRTLYVVSGEGRYQTEGERVVAIRAGDTVWIPPGERHWHGAAPDQMMCHIAFQEALDGSHIAWQEPVSDADYTADPE